MYTTWSRSAKLFSMYNYPVRLVWLFFPKITNLQYTRDRPSGDRIFSDRKFRSIATAILCTAQTTREICCFNYTIYHVTPTKKRSRFICWFRSLLQCDGQFTTECISCDKTRDKPLGKIPLEKASEQQPYVHVQCYICQVSYYIYAQTSYLSNIWCVVVE